MTRNMDVKKVKSQLWSTINNEISIDAPRNQDEDQEMEDEEMQIIP